MAKAQYLLAFLQVNGYFLLGQGWVLIALLITAHEPPARQWRELRRTKESSGTASHVSASVRSTAQGRK